MENALEGTSASSNAAIKVEVINVDDFREDLMQKVIAGVAVTVAISVTKLVFDVINEKRKAKKTEKAKEAEPKLKTVKKN